MTYPLASHCQTLLQEYRAHLPIFEKMKEIVQAQLSQCVHDNNLYVAAIELRIKKEKSLAGKLELKGHKYSSLRDITDILGARIITFYMDEVDKIAALVEKLFVVDWEESVDKRKALELDQFGYMSLHYICRIPVEIYYDPDCPEINEFRFELQMRTALQHVWANMNHDTGYKSGIEIPKEYLRNLNRIAGMLELADSQFSLIRKEINDYRRKVHELVADGNFDSVALDEDTFRRYLTLQPFNKLMDRIAAVNQAEIYEDNLMPYYEALRQMGFATLGDIEKMVKNCSDEAYQLVLHQLAATDFDIVALSVALKNLCLIYLLKQGAGEKELVNFYNTIFGVSDYNSQRAQQIIQLFQKSINH